MIVPKPVYICFLFALDLPFLSSFPPSLYLVFTSPFFLLFSPRVALLLTQIRAPSPGPSLPTTSTHACNIFVDSPLHS